MPSNPLIFAIRYFSLPILHFPIFERKDSNHVKFRLKVEFITKNINVFEGCSCHETYFICHDLPV